MSEMSLIMLAAGNSTRFNTKVKNNFYDLEMTLFGFMQQKI